MQKAGSYQPNQRSNRKKQNDKAKSKKARASREHQRRRRGKAANGVPAAVRSYSAGRTQGLEISSRFSENSQPQEPGTVGSTNGRRHRHLEGG
jgi:hypothetical protein